MPPDTPPPEPPPEGAAPPPDGSVPAAGDTEPVAPAANANRNRNLAIAAGIVVVLALLAAALLLTGGDDDDQADSADTATTLSADDVGSNGTADDGEAGGDPDSTDPNATDSAGNPIDGNGDGTNGNSTGNGGPGGVDPGEPVTVPPADLAAAYARGFTDVCNEIWSVSSSGYVVDPDDPEVLLPIDDCLFDLDETLGEFEDTVEDAYAAGRAEAEITAENLTFSGALCNESLERCWQVP